MGLFKKKENKSEIDRNIKSYTIPYSKNFKGFKHFLIQVYGNETSEKNNLLFLDKDFSNSKFEFICSDYDNGRMAQLFIDDQIVGVVFEEEHIQAIENGSIIKIHARPKENGNKRLTFFVKYKE